MSAESDTCSGRPSTNRNKEVIEDCHLTLRKIVKVGISRESVHSILTEERFVHVKSVGQIHSQAADRATEGVPCGNRPKHAVIIGDETGVYDYDPESKFRSSQWKHPESPRPKNA